MICGKCGKECRSLTVCSHCDLEIEGQVEEERNEVIETLEVRETEDPMLIYVGQNKEYYREAWANKRNPGSSIGWNWPAFLVTPFWLVYRKMYIYAFVWFAIFIGSELFNSTVQNIVSLVIWLGVGLFGNTLYFNHVKKTVHAIQKKFPNDIQGEVEIQKSGGTSTKAVWVVIGLYLLYNTIVFIAFSATFWK